MAGQVGFKTESVWGTAVTVDKFMPVTRASVGSGNIARQINREGISSRLIRKPGKKGAIVPKPALELEVSNKNGIAVLFKHMFGNVVTSGGGPFTHTYTPATVFGDSLTVQVGITDATATVQPFTADGVKISSWELSCAVDGNLMLSMECTARNVVTATALATASYSDDEAFTFIEGTVSIAGVPVASANSFTLRFQKNLRDERLVLGSQFIRQQLEDGFFDITGTVEADFDSLTHYASAVASTTVAIVLLFTSGGAGAETLTITASGQLTGDAPELSSPGLQSQTLNFEITHATADASAITAVLVNTETSAA